MAAHTILSRIVIYIIIPMHIHVSTVNMIKQSLELLPEVKVDLDFCYSVRYDTHFVGEIKCSSDCSVYNSQIQGQILYSPEQRWQFQEKPFIAMCSCNFNTTELRNGNVIGDGVVSHESYLNYTCHPGFEKTILSRILCLDGIFVSVDDIELHELKQETSAIFRKNPMSNKDFSKFSNSVYKFVIDSDSWIHEDSLAQKGFVYQHYNGKVSYKLLGKREETSYKDGHIDISSHREIGCIKEITYPLTSVDSVDQNIRHILSVSVFGSLIVIFIATGIMLLCLAKRKVSKALQKKSRRERDQLFLNIRQESASTSSGVFCLITVSDKSQRKFSTHLTDFGELYVTENKHLFYSKSGNCRIACLRTPDILRKSLSSDDLFGTIHAKYLEYDHDGDEHLPQDSERAQCSNMKENINSRSRHILKRSESESGLLKNDLQSKDLHIRSHSDSRIHVVHLKSIVTLLNETTASANTVSEENNARVVNEDQIEESNVQLERFNQAVEVCVDVMNERRKSDDSSKSDEEDISLHREDNDERERTPLMAETEDMKHDGNSDCMQKTSVAEDGEGELQDKNGCSLDSNYSKSEMTLSLLSSRELGSDSLRWKSDPYIFTPSLLERAWRGVRNKLFSRKNQYLQSFRVPIEMDCI